MLCVLVLDIYPSTAYQCDFIVLIDNINIFLDGKKNEMELKCHHNDVTNVDIFHHTKHDVRDI